MEDVDEKYIGIDMASAPSVTVIETWTNKTCACGNFMKKKYVDNEPVELWCVYCGHSIGINNQN